MLNHAAIVACVLGVFCGGATATAQTGTQPDTVTLRYVFLMNGKRSGSEVDTYTGTNKVDSTFEFNDRGRGPKIEAHYVLTADSRPARIDITGVDYLKSSVDEHFSLEAGVSHWKSTSEDGSAQTGGFY
jgi:hypothetical protein